MKTEDMKITPISSTENDRKRLADVVAAREKIERLTVSSDTRFIAERLDRIIELLERDEVVSSVSEGPPVEDKATSGCWCQPGPPVPAGARTPVEDAETEPSWPTAGTAVEDDTAEGSTARLLDNLAEDQRRRQVISEDARSRQLVEDIADFVASNMEESAVDWVATEDAAARFRAEAARTVPRDRP